MKKRTVLLIGLLGCLMFTTIQGCGQPAEEETVSVVEETVSESVEESVSEEPTASEEKATEETEESSVEETVPIETEATTEETETEVPTETIEEVSITEMDATMYATTGVNVRESYSAESNKLRTVGIGEAVHVTGQTADGSWYRIEDAGVGEGFISAQYLSTEKPVIEQPAPQQEAVVNEDVQDPNNLPDAPAPDHPEAWAPLGEPEYTDGSEFTPTLDGSNLGTGYDGPPTGMTWQ